MDKNRWASWIDAERRERSDQTFRWCGLVKKSLPMKNALSLEFIHRCIYNACSQKEWLPMHLSIACVCVCVWVAYTCLWKTVCCVCVCIISSHVQSVWETASADWWENVFFLTSLRSGFTLREIWFLTLHCFYCCLKVSEAYAISLLRACVCVLMMSAYLCVFCWCVFFLMCRHF